MKSMERDKVLPEFFMTSEPGSFAEKCVLVRMPQVIENVIVDNDYPLYIVENLKDFRKEVLKEQVHNHTCRYENQ